MPPVPQCRILLDRRDKDPFLCGLHISSTIELLLKYGRKSTHTLPSLPEKCRDHHRKMSSTLVSSTATGAAAAAVATVEALTTAFTAPTTCNQMQLTQLSSPGYQVWLNEPQPVPGTKFPNCYPSEFMKDYTSVFNQSSSIAPMMSPLVAPDNWVTVKEMDDGYIALCPSYVNFLLQQVLIAQETNSIKGVLDL